MIETTHKKIGVGDLSSTLREWLSSVQLMLITMDLNQRLGLSGEKEMIIPLAVWKLVSGRVEPTQFISELSHRLEISPSAAKALAQEVEEKILRPIEFPLRTELGVDIKTIYLGDAPSPSPKEAEAHEPTPPKATSPEFLIQTQEAAHPAPKQSVGIGQVPQTPIPRTSFGTGQAPAPIKSPVYSPASIPAPTKIMPAPMPPKPPMPKVEPLMANKAEPLTQRPTPAPVSQPIPSAPIQPKPATPPAPAQSQTTPIPVKIMPSKVPSFLKPEDFQNPNR